jgi:hypothetical protein
MELAFANARSVPAWLALRRPILPTSPFLASFRVADHPGVRDVCLGTSEYIARHTDEWSLNKPWQALVLTSGGNMSIPLRCLRAISLVLTLSSPVVAGQNGAIVCRRQFKTANNCYRLYKPADPARGLVVMLPYYGSDANEFSSVALPGLLAKKNVVTMVVSASGYLVDDDLMTLKGLIGEVVQELNIPAGRLVIGGISAGGTGAVRYSEYCISGHCDVRSRPVAIFSVDAPLDFESWWNKREIEPAARQNLERFWMRCVRPWAVRPLRSAKSIAVGPHS